MNRKSTKTLDIAIAEEVGSLEHHALNNCSVDEAFLCLIRLVYAMCFVVSR